MSARTAARLRRSEMKAETARELSRVLFDHDVEQLDVADATGALASVVQRWCDRKRLETISLADVVLLGESYPRAAREIVSWAARRMGLEVVTRLRAVAPADHLTHLARRAKEHADTTVALLEGLSDGVLSDEDVARLDRELLDEEEANAELRAWIDGERERRRMSAGAAERGDGA